MRIYTGECGKNVQNILRNANFLNLDSMLDPQILKILSKLVLDYLSYVPSC